MVLSPILLVSSLVLLLPDLVESQEPGPKLPQPEPFRSAVWFPPEIRHGAELSIIGVRRIGTDPIRTGETVPVEIVVRNKGNRAAAVRAQSRDTSQGTARFAYGPEAPVEPEETAIWRLDLVAMGSGFTIGGRGGGALCDERSERTITLLEAPPAIAPSGYRPGNHAVAGALTTFRDGNNADNERIVSFQFNCSVSFQE